MGDWGKLILKNPGKDLKSWKAMNDLIYTNNIITCNGKEGSLASDEWG